MGQEILYCSRCQTRLMGNDLERGTAIRVGNTVACKDCAPEVLLALPPEQRPQTPKPRKTSTGRIPIIRPPSSSSTATRAAARRDDPPPPRPPPPSKTNLHVGIGIGVAVLVLGLAAMMSGGSSSSGSRSRDTDSGTPRYQPDDPKDTQRSTSSSSSSSGGVLDRVKKRVRDNPNDLDGNVAAAQEAFKQVGSPEAKDLLEVLLTLQRNAYAKEFAAVEKDVAVPADRGDFARAKVVLEEARKRHATEDWASRINGKLAELTTREAASKPPTPPPPPPPSPAPGAEKPWKALFDGKNGDFLNPLGAANWRFADGALEKVKEGGDAAQSRADIGDGELRIRFEEAGLASAYFKVRQGAEGGYSVSFENASLVSLEGKPHDLVFIMKGDQVSATLDGQPVPVVAEGTPATGRVQFNGQGRMLRILSVETR